ncbi:hypothetical protein [Longirhabdus pacifica]|uniref:hypothetical protein n=1 Tax=Longirhabdus pacifica TaxID=2305227 RepID=UPI0013E8B495|nr:hypothetical protein [Longirhabdus pacifica]
MSIGLIGLIIGLIQIFYPEAIMAFKPLGIKNTQQIRIGGYPTVVISIVIIIFAIFAV